MNSLERRLHLGLIVSILVLMALLWIVGNQSVRRLTEDFIASRLEHDADGLLAALAAMPGGGVGHVRPNRIDQVYHQPLSGHYYLILPAEGQPLISRSLWDHRLEVPRQQPGEQVLFRRPGPSEQDLLVFAKGVRKQGVGYTVAVAEDISPLKARRDEFRRGFVLLGVTGLFGLLLVQSLVLRRSFRRLEQVREDVRRLEQGEAKQLSEEVPSEVLPLVREFNHLLGLLSQRLERSRNALGNLAHALKGPLNLLGRYVERGEGGRDEAGVQVERIRQLMERELKRARLAGQGLSARRFDAARELPDLVAALKQIHREREPEIHWHVQPGVAPFGDREDMLELLGNLLDNACKWTARSVQCEVGQDGGIEFVIADDGTGVSPAVVERLTNRGVRLDEGVDGHGLGLAIAKDIVKLYGGSIGFSQSATMKGLEVRVRLPLASSA